jgi:uncharacterized membrane protein
MGRGVRLVAFMASTVAAIVIAIVGVAWFVTRSPDPSQPRSLPSRHADIFGRAQIVFGTGYSWDGKLPGTIGPMTARIGDTIVSIPSATSLYGTSCGAFLADASGPARAGSVPYGDCGFACP